MKIEIWFQDEARIGQKNKITRRWAERGTRPSEPHDLRTKWVYLFGAICPAKGEAIGLVLPWYNTEAMNAHLTEIWAAVDPSAHAVLILDQAPGIPHPRSARSTTSPCCSCRPRPRN